LIETNLFDKTMTTATTLAPSAPTAAHAASAIGEYLSFRLGNVEYGIDILKVQEIRGYESPTRIANAPHYLKGVQNLRGVIVPIVDLRVKLGQQDPSFDHMTVTVILNLGRGLVGAVVDAVSDVIELAADQIRPAPAFDDNVDVTYITGIGTLAQGEQERMLLLLDIEQLMVNAINANPPTTVH
jgi:purine-binding chemotaxis protein CheW